MYFVLLAESIVEVFDKKNNRIAVHPSSKKKYGYSTTLGHMPEKHKSMLYAALCSRLRHSLNCTIFLGYIRD
ncbi:MAG: hypothetical protein ABIA63_06875 [bacterium]